MSQAQADKIVKAYVAIRDDLKKQQKAFDEIKAGHKQKMALLEDEMKKICDKVGVKSLPTAYGTASLVSKDFVKVTDWGRALEYIKSNDLWHLLTKKVSKVEVKDFMESHDNVVPPGLEYGATQEISVRRPTKRKG